MARLFISQERLDAWSAEGRVEVAGDVMTLKADGRSFKISPAVRFLSVSGGEPDANDLVDRVKSDSELVELGADQYMESVILGDIAYDVQSGFIGDPVGRARSGK